MFESLFLLSQIVHRFIHSRATIAQPVVRRTTGSTIDRASLKGVYTMIHVPVHVRRTGVRPTCIIV